MGDCRVSFTFFSLFSVLPLFWGVSFLEPALTPTAKVTRGELFSTVAQVTPLEALLNCSRSEKVVMLSFTIYDSVLPSAYLHGGGGGDVEPLGGGLGHAAAGGHQG